MLTKFYLYERTTGFLLGTTRAEDELRARIQFGPRRGYRACDINATTVPHHRVSA